MLESYWMRMRMCLHVMNGTIPTLAISIPYFILRCGSEFLSINLNLWSQNVIIVLHTRIFQASFNLMTSEKNKKEKNAERLHRTMSSISSAELFLVHGVTVNSTGWANEQPNVVLLLIPSSQWPLYRFVSIRARACLCRAISAKMLFS